MMTVRLHMSQEDFLVKWCWDLNESHERVTRMRDARPDGGYRGDKAREFATRSAREVLLVDLIRDLLVVARTAKYHPLYQRIEEADPDARWFGVNEDGLLAQEVCAFAREIVLLDKGRKQLQPGEYEEIMAATIEGYVESPETESELDELRRQMIVKGHKDLFDPERDKDWLNEQLVKVKEFYQVLTKNLPEGALDELADNGGPELAEATEQQIAPRSEPDWTEPFPVS